MNALLGMAYKLRNAANRNTRLNADVALLCEYALAAADTMEAEHSRLIEGLRLIECEPLNAEYMARNILDGLPAYHDTMLKCGEGCKCKVGAGKTAVLDACCGSRMFWFDRKDSRATFVDKRRERHTLPDISSNGGSRELVIDPDHLADFTDLPFPDNTFALVVFDPPHFERNGATGWVGLKYGTLKGDWQTMLREGFAECFRVLRPDGVLIFKWCEDEIPVSRILALTPERPLFGHKSGKQQKTHWVTFMKTPNA
jgi:SAM-dependent methyltransferase